MNTLLAGGLVAAVVAGWQQLRNIFTYLSSFIVVRAQLDDTTTLVMREYIRKEWNLLPSGLHVYCSKYFTFKDQSFSTIVPFKLPANGGIYVKGWKVLFVKETHETITVSYIRGLVNFDQLLKDVIFEFNNRFGEAHEKGASSYNRYQVIRHMGAERSYSGDVKPRIGSRAELSPEGASTSDSSKAYLNPSVDLPLLYDKSMWTYSKKEDPFRALYFPSHILDHVNQLRHWLANGNWYAERMIPWRRGILFYGRGGTGKTSLAKAIAQELEIPIHQYHLSTLSDQEFVDAWDNMITPCVALLEDYDNVFHGRENITAHKLLSFDCLLNQISGVNSHNGVLLIVTTNHIEHIDPAMGIVLDSEGKHKGISTRPGRIDAVIEVGDLDKEGRQFLANRILRDWPEAIPPLVNLDYPVTPAVFQEMCVQEAFKLMRNNPEVQTA